MDVLLNLAEAYGWRPAGTLAPEAIKPAEWSGQYDSSERQRVSVADALTLAEALDRALKDAHRPAREKTLAASLGESLGKHLGKAVSIEPPEDDTLLREFAIFCRGGSFLIE